MESINNKLVLNNKEDEDLLYDRCDSYLYWWNQEDEDESVNEAMKLDSDKLSKLIREETGFTRFYDMNLILQAFSHREEHFIQLWKHILNCFVEADLVVIGG